MRDVLWVLWMVAGWICLGLPSAVGSIDGELSSRSGMGRGRGPGRWATADGFIPSFTMGVFFGSFQSLWAM